MREAFRDSAEHIRRQRGDWLDGVRFTLESEGEMSTS